MTALAIVTDRIVIRCSSLDRLIECAGSLEPVDEPYTPNNPEAREGTAGHEALSYVPRGIEPPVMEIADSHRVDVEVLNKMVSRGRECWEDVGPWFKGKREVEYGFVEVELAPGVFLRGTTDQLSRYVENDALLEMGVLDWKTGFDPPQHAAQVRGYAYLARALFGMPRSGYILGVESHIRAGRYYVHKFTAAQLDAFRDELLEQVRLRGRQFGPGNETCKYCPRQTACHALESYKRSGIAPLEVLAANQAVTPQLMGALYEQRKLIGRALTRYDDVLRGMLESGAEVRLPDGRKLMLEEQEQDEIIPSAAQPLLDTLKLDDAERDTMTSITKGGLEKVLKGRVAYGKLAGAMREAMKTLNTLKAVRKVSKRVTKIVA